MALEKDAYYQFNNWSQSLEEEFDSIGKSFINNKQRDSQLTPSRVDNNNSIHNTTYLPNLNFEKNLFSNNFNNDSEPHLGQLALPSYSQKNSYDPINSTYTQSNKLKSQDFTSNKDEVPNTSYPTKSLNQFLGIERPAFEISDRTTLISQKNSFLSNSILEEHTNSFRFHPKVYKYDSSTVILDNFNIKNKNFVTNEQNNTIKRFDTTVKKISSQSTKNFLPMRYNTLTSIPKSNTNNNSDYLFSLKSMKNTSLPLNEHFDDIQHSPKLLNINSKSYLKNEIISRNEEENNNKYFSSLSNYHSLDNSSTLRSLQSENNKLMRNYNNINMAHENGMNELLELKNKVLKLEKCLENAQNQVKIKELEIERLEKRLILFETLDNSTKSYETPIKTLNREQRKIYSSVQTPNNQIYSNLYYKNSTNYMNEKKINSLHINDSETTNNFSKLKNLLENARQREKKIDKLINSTQDIGNTFYKNTANDEEPQQMTNIPLFLENIQMNNIAKDQSIASKKSNNLPSIPLPNFPQLNSIKDVNSKPSLNNNKFSSSFSASAPLDTFNHKESNLNSQLPTSELLSNNKISSTNYNSNSETIFDPFSSEIHASNFAADSKFITPKENSASIVFNDSNSFSEDWSFTFPDEDVFLKQNDSFDASYIKNSLKEQNKSYNNDLMKQYPDSNIHEESLGSKSTEITTMNTFGDISNEEINFDSPSSQIVA